MTRLTNVDGIHTWLAYAEPDWGQRPARVPSMSAAFLARPGRDMAGTMRTGKKPGNWELRVELSRVP